MRAKAKRLKKQRADKRRKDCRLPSAPKMWDVSAQADRWPFDSEPPCSIYIDDEKRLTIMVFRSSAPGPFAGSLRVGIRLNERPAVNGKETPLAQILCTWSELQAVKNHYWPHRQAVEIYPERDQVINAAPLRWLWVLPAGFRLPFDLGEDGEKQNPD